MATSRKLSLLFTFLMVIFGVSQAFGSFDCCVKYSKRKIDLKMIEGYQEQRSTEVCDIDAIVFEVRTSPCTTITIRKCADPKQKWVKDRMRALDQRTNKKSKLRRIKKLQKSCKRLRKQLY